MAPLRCHVSAVEKRTPHYALDSIKATFTTSASLRMTRTAQNTASALGVFLAQGYLVISFKEK